MSMRYSDPSREDDLTSLPDLEVFYHGGGDLGDVLEEDSAPGWYHWPCLLGALPDRDPAGPFDSEDLALNDARRRCRGVEAG